MLTVSGSVLAPSEPNERAAPDQPQRPSAGWRFGFGSTLALAMGIGPLAIYVLSALSPAIIAELALTRTQFGILATTSYLVTASVSIVTGGAIDRARSRTVMVVLFVLGGASLAGIGLAPGYFALLIAVALSGLTQALSNPVTNQAIATLLPAGQRGLTMGVKQSGVQMCQFVAGATLPIMAVAIGWRGATLTMPILAVGGIVLAFVVMPGERGHRQARARVPRRDRAPLPAAVWWLAAYSLLIGAGLQATNVYVPLYSYEEVGLGAVLAGGTTGLLGAVGVVSRMGWGRLAERVSPPQRPLAVLAIGGMAAAGLLYLAPWVTALVWVGVAVHALSAVAANVVTMMAVVRVVELPQLGRASGVLALGLYLGFAIGPVAFGALADATGTYGLGWLCLIGVYLLAAVVTRLWSGQERRVANGATVDETALSSSRDPGDGV